LLRRQAGPDRGRVEGADLDEVRQAGFGDGAIAEAVAHVAAPAVLSVNDRAVQNDDGIHPLIFALVIFEGFWYAMQVHCYQEREPVANQEHTEQNGDKDFCHV
jgi:hypothetical protein